MSPLANPIEGMPGGSVSGCIKTMKRTRKDIDDPGAYCAAIADRIEPGWRTKNPKKQLGLFGEEQAEIEGFALTHPEAEPAGRFQEPRGRQERFFADKPDPDVMEAIRRRELAERRKKKKRKKNSDVVTLKRRLLRF